MTIKPLENNISVSSTVSALSCRHLTPGDSVHIPSLEDPVQPFHGMRTKPHLWYINANAGRVPFLTKGGSFGYYPKGVPQI
jgi:hypothetical protein